MGEITEPTVQTSNASLTTPSALTSNANTSASPNTPFENHSEFAPQPLWWCILSAGVFIYSLTIPIAFVNLKVIARTSVCPILSHESVNIHL